MSQISRRAKTKTGVIIEEDVHLYEPTIVRAHFIVPHSLYPHLATYPYYRAHRFVPFSLVFSLTLPFLFPCCSLTPCQHSVTSNLGPSASPISSPTTPPANSSSHSPSAMAFLARTPKKPSPTPLQLRTELGRKLLIIRLRL